VDNSGFSPPLRFLHKLSTAFTAFFHRVIHRQAPVGAVFPGRSAVWWETGGERAVENSKKSFKNNGLISIFVVDKCVEKLWITGVLPRFLNFGASCALNFGVRAGWARGF
jgi:hypothetical protein